VTLLETQELGAEKERERGGAKVKAEQPSVLSRYLHILPDKSNISHNTHRNFCKGGI